MSALTKRIKQESYTFDDLLLVPAYSQVLPSDVDISTSLSKHIPLNVPIISAAMDTVTEFSMALNMALLGGLGFVHKNMTPENQATIITKIKKHKIDFNAYPLANIDAQKTLLAGAAVGVANNTLQRVEALVDAGVNILTVDSAHGHSKGVIDTVKQIKKRFPKIIIVGGNIVTADAAKALVDVGADVVKVGVGGGSICTTRVIAGIGLPQLSAIADVYDYTQQHNIGLIADGGIRYSGDIVKALAAGANAVMLGGLLAATEESPGKIITIDNKKYKIYEGMGSLSAMGRGSKDRYFQTNNDKKKLVPEGVEAKVPLKGNLSDILYQLCGGLRSGMGYCGTKNLHLLRTSTYFTKITTSGLIESHPHSIKL